MITAARNRLLMSRDPRGVFFASLAMRLVAKPSSKCDVFACDGVSLFYNPTEVVKLTPGEVLGCIVHEVLHCVMKHHLRMDQRNAAHWNLACDLAINPIVLDAGFVLPDGVMLPEQLGLPRGESSEFYYDKLPQSTQQQPPQPGDKQEQSQAGGDQASGQASGHCSGKSQAQQPKQPDPEPEQAQPEQSQPEQSQPEPEHARTPNPKNFGEIMPPPQAQPGDDQDQDQTETDWDAAAINAEQRASKRGNLPGSLQRAVTETLRPKLDWRAVLREFVSQRARSDFSWSRPSRRSESMGFYMPSSRSDDLGHVALVIDVSGSITRETLNKFAAEAQEALSLYPCTVRVYYHDTSVRLRQDWTREDGPLLLQSVGGGGTDHRPVFEEIERGEQTPDLILCCTDGETDWPAYCQIPTLFAMVGTVVAPFGVTARIM